MKNNTHSQPTCVVTGGSSGIGLATCKLFAQHGYRIAMCGRDQDRLSAAEEDIQSHLGGNAPVLTYVADVGRNEQARAFVDFANDQFGRIDVLVNNAGIAPRAPIAEMPLDDFWRLLDVNIVSVFSTVQAAWPTMTAQGGGIIINISSISAIDPFPGLGLYGSCKAFVEALTLATAREGKPVGIRAFGIRPGAVETPLLRRLFPDFPAENCLDPMDVANVVLAFTELSYNNRSGEIAEVRK